MLRELKLKLLLEWGFDEHFLAVDEHIKLVVQLGISVSLRV